MRRKLCDKQSSRSIIEFWEEVRGTLNVPLLVHEDISVRRVRHADFPSSDLLPQRKYDFADVSTRFHVRMGLVRSLQRVD